MNINYTPEVPSSQSPCDVQALSMIQLFRLIYGMTNVLVGSVADIEQHLLRGTNPLMVCVVEHELTDAQLNTIQAWMDAPTISFNLAIFTGSTTLGAAID